MQIKPVPGIPWSIHGRGLTVGKPAGADPPGAATLASIEKTRSACAGMESLFLNHLLQEMQATVPKSGLLGSGTATSLYTDMLHQHLSRELAEGGGIGLADILMAQLTSGADGAAVGKSDDEERGSLDPGPKV